MSGEVKQNLTKKAAASNLLMFQEFHPATLTSARMYQELIQNHQTYFHLLTEKILANTSIQVTISEIYILQQIMFLIIETAETDF